MAYYDTGYNYVGGYGNQYSQQQAAYANGPMRQYSGAYPQSSMRSDWVQGEAAAKAYPNIPGMLTLLMDSDQPVLYVKMTDQTGRPQPLEVYDLVKRGMYSQNPGNQAQLPGWSGHGSGQQVEYVQPDMSEYVKKTDLENKVREIMNSQHPQGVMQ